MDDSTYLRVYPSPPDAPILLSGRFTGRYVMYELDLQEAGGLARAIIDAMLLKIEHNTE